MSSQNKHDSEMSPSIFINHRTLKNDKKINNFKPGALRIKLLRTETTVDDEIEEQQQQQHIPFMILMEHVYISRHREREFFAFTRSGRVNEGMANKYKTRESFSNDCVNDNKRRREQKRSKKSLLFLYSTLNPLTRSTYQPVQRN
jgi:hypothetical protein